MLYRLSQIILIIVYLSAGYPQINGVKSFFTAKISVPVKSKLPARTQFFSPTLQTHVVTHSHIPLADQDNDFAARVTFGKHFTQLIIPSPDEIYTGTFLINHFNKAPPLA